MSLTATTPLSAADYEADLYDPLDESNVMIREERNPSQVLFFIPSFVAALVSYFAGGIQTLNDFAWLVMTALCIVFLLGEFRSFSFRWGIGGMLLYGGSLVWLCYDYMVHWFGLNIFKSAAGLYGYSPATLARSTLAHTIFIPMMVLGMRIRLGGHLENWITKLPGPRSSRAWVILFLTMFLIGLIPYIFFTRDGLFVSLWNEFWAGRAGTGAAWTVGRTGNANYSYGAYLAQVLQVGTFGSILASYWAITYARTWTGRLLAFLLWLPALGTAFGSGARSNVVLLFIPAIGFLFMRFQAEAANRGRRVSLRAYGWLVGLLLTVLAIVQVQIAFRSVGFSDIDTSKVSFSADKIEGNAMFSEGLPGFEQIPEYIEPFYDRVPGQAIVMPVLDSAYWFFVSPFPRALWTTKPLDPVGIWYNKLVGHTENGVEGTTIASGAVGAWYFRFGWWGAIEGGLFVGFFMGMVERMLRNYGNRPLTVFISLALATFIFRAYRGWNYLDLHPVLVGVGGLIIMYIPIRLLTGDRPDYEETA